MKVHDIICAVCTFISSEIVSDYALDLMEQEIVKEGKQLGYEHYFELTTQNLPSEEMKRIECICAKIHHHRGEPFVLFYLEGVFYCQILEGPKAHALLHDIIFPNIDHHDGKGLTIKLNDQNEKIKGIIWKKLSLWQMLPKKNIFMDLITTTKSDSTRTISLASDTYGQCYMIKKPSKEDASIRDVLFQFGSWNYCGEVKLLPQLGIEDIEHVIPVLQTQQHELSFLCHSSDMPIQNTFTEPLKYITKINSIIDQEILSVENNIERINLDEDPTNLFFEFQTAPHHETTFEKFSIDCMASKSYRASGLVIMTVYFKGTFYVFLRPGNDNLQLLDSSFPSIIPSVGYNLKSYPSGTVGWPNLRRLSLWKVNKFLADESKDNCQHTSMEEDGFNHNGIRSHHTRKYSMLIEENSKEPQVDPEELETNKNFLNGNFTSTRATCGRKVNGFYHLAPLKKESKLKVQILRGGEQNIIHTVSWDREGKPLVSNM